MHVFWPAFGWNVPAGQSTAPSSLLPLSSVAASQQESKVIIRKAFHIIPVLACLKGDNRGKDLGTDLTKQMMTTRRTIAERNLLSMHVISINKQGGVAIVTSAEQELLPEMMVQRQREARVASALAEPAVKYWPAGQAVTVLVERDMAALVPSLKSDAEHVVSALAEPAVK